MLAAAYAGQGRVEVIERPPAEPGPGQVVLDVAYVGICGTDLHIFHGAMDARLGELPAVIGHEMSGRIAAVGEGVQGWSVGDAVTVMPLDWDGTCPACVAGNEHVCQHLTFVGIDSPGALQDRWVVDASWLIALPEHLGLREAALAEPVAVAVHDVRRSGLTPGATAIVIGGGPIGLLIAVVATHLGARVLVSEPDPGRRSMLERVGLTTVDPMSEDVATVVAERTHGAGADVVFEVSGAAPAVQTATDVAKVRGTVVMVAIHPQPTPVDLKAVFWKELAILGARVYTRPDFEEAVELLGSGVVPSGTVISTVLSLRETAEGFAMLERGEAMKVLIDCGVEA